MKQIIVPIDFSELSLKGLDLALLLSGYLKSNIELVHVMQDKKNIYAAEAGIDHKKVEHHFDNLIKKYKEKGTKTDLSYVIKEGKIHNEVISQATSHEDSLIVTSTHGNSGWEELFMGSNAYKIVASSTCPVFTVRGENIPKSIKKIVLPIDITPETREKVPFTAKLAKAFNAEVDIITVHSSDSFEIKDVLVNHGKQVVNYLNYLNIKNSLTELYGNNLTDITIEYAVKVKADLISIMSEQEKSVANLLLGSYAHQMINKSTVPVVCFPTKQIGVITEAFQTLGVNY
ncbi:MAG: universal stress protein [Bacteroidales bacterium]|nr:universal stress protein [Bacteroidales bacterium]